MEEINQKIGSSEDNTLNQIERILQSQANFQKEILKLKTQLLNSKIGDIITAAKQVEKFKIISEYLEEMDIKNLGDFADTLKKKLNSGVVVLASTKEGKPLFVVSLTQEAVDNGLNAGLIAKEIGVLINGTGGGRKDFAQGGGKDSAKLKTALEKIPEIISKLIR